MVHIVCCTLQLSVGVKQTQRESFGKDVNGLWTASNDTSKSITISDGDAADGHCQFLDEAPALRWCASGAPAGSELRITAHDQDGRSWPVEPITLAVWVSRSVSTPAWRRASVQPDSPAVTSPADTRDVRTRTTSFRRIDPVFLNSEKTSVPAPR